jgi:ribosomal protection tetracycline resistance protein
MAARREILIDAYNVIFAHPKLGPLVRRDPARARDEFLSLVATRLPQDGSLGVVVFDAMRDPRPPTETGRTGRERQRGLQVVYARETADAWIQARIRDHSEPGALTIVTSDNAILATARAHGAGILKVSDFLQLAARRQARLRELRSSEKPTHQSSREIEEWERLFGEHSRDGEEGTGGSSPES